MVIYVNEVKWYAEQWWVGYLMYPSGLSSHWRNDGFQSLPFEMNEFICCDYSRALPHQTVIKFSAASDHRLNLGLSSSNALNDLMKKTYKAWSSLMSRSMFCCIFFSALPPCLLLCLSCTVCVCECGGRPWLTYTLATDEAHLQSVTSSDTPWNSGPCCPLMYSLEISSCYSPVFSCCLLWRRCVFFELWFPWSPLVPTYLCVPRCLTWPSLAVSWGLVYKGCCAQNLCVYKDELCFDSPTSTYYRWVLIKTAYRCALHGFIDLTFCCIHRFWGLKVCNI